MKLVLVRHGESTWNKKNIFTGWTDVDLSSKGVLEAQQAGKMLKDNNYYFDVCYTSILKRAIRTMELIFQEMKINPPIIYDYRLNERHYGALQGLNKAETAQKYGDEQVKQWRRSLNVKPPLLTLDDKRHPQNQSIFAHLDPHLLPSSESLADTMERVLEIFQNEILSDIKQGRQVIIVAHGNSLRALVAYLDKLNEKQILELNIPTGIPLVYELDEKINVLEKYYLN